ncbi:hypothetical protein LOC68_12080 [Blastopirellula sp. JC732]|uniref:Uncharacterized protein n=1 Tax=Blastopirellula sediminis TaxID=2894196 RepID=A0A9X1MNH9_9BACT|nr:hypothetical protein [Blastopirellula sediminis]MCC9607570.1 hypothetical protein [Blastopirellula sediminis]MCC9629137.1 hypothetical protein [Blastopirellula sediminis]
MSGQIEANESAEVDQRTPAPYAAHVASWRFLLSIVVMAAIWGLLFLIAWFGQPGMIIAILMIYAGSFAAISLLGTLVSLPLLSLTIRLPVSLAMLLVTSVITLYFWDSYDSSEFHLWLLLIALQYTVVAVLSAVVTQLFDLRAPKSRHFSLLTLILIVTAVCVGMGVVRAIASALDVGWDDWADSRVSSFFTVALMNATAAIGPIQAFVPQRTGYRVLLLVIGLPQAILYTLGILWLHSMLFPDERVMSHYEAAFFVGVQEVSIALSLLPILLAPGKPIPQQKSPPQVVDVLQQEP